MQSKSDAQLLGEYAEHGAEAAFNEIVARHANLVYSAALRQVDSPDLAAEVAQGVFIGLARDARDLSRKLAANASLAGWLCRSARNRALNLRRDEFRRHARERQAMQNLDSPPDTPPDWERLRPVLDDAMSGLSDPDYDALVLRFFQNQDLRSVGLALGLSDDAAQKRVVRALDKLRGLLSQRGFTTPAAVLSTVLSANAVQVAPAGLAATLSTAALAGTTLTTAATATATKAIAMTTLQKILVTASIVAASLATPLVIQHQSQIRLRAENETLRQQVAQLGQPATASIAAPPVASTTSSPALSNDQFTELLRLRGEVGVLRGQASEMRRLEEDNRRLRNAFLAGTNPTTSDGQRATNAPSPTVEDVIMPPGSISWRAVNVNQALQIYSVLADTEIDADEQVRRLRIGLAFTNSEAVKRTEAIRLLEGVFHDQAAIETTHPETNRTVFRLRK